VNRSILMEIGALLLRQAKIQSPAAERAATLRVRPLPS
jgi:hypothetical protein